MNNEQDHWSIGEVLALLQDEFPEVTISKIRFLESQGLVQPERTPSGYRRFYDADYDRLFWILKQQRDHYLPLRVIRDRLDSGVAIAPAPRREMASTPATVNVEWDDQQPEHLEDPDFEPQVTSAPPAAEQPSESTVGEAEQSSGGTSSSFGESIAPSVGQASGGAGFGGSRDRLDRVPNALDDAVAASEDGPLDAEIPAKESPRQRNSDVPPLEGTQNSATVSAYLAAAGARGFSPADSGESQVNKGKSIRAQADKAEPEVDVDATQPAHGESDSQADAASEPETEAEPEEAVPASIPGSSVALTREQLADQAGCPYSLVADLEKYGMIVGHRIGNGVLFDSTALTISRLAIEFNRYGIEPRHLKAFRLGAEREVEILTQGIGPTLHANNADTRRRSFETLNDLSELGASLRRILVRDLVAQHAPEG